MSRGRVLVTRSGSQARALAEPLERTGFDVVAIPTIELADPPSWKPVDAAIERLDEYDAILLTSANAAQRFLGRLSSTGALGGFPVYAIGEKTAAALRDASVAVAGIPTDARAEGLLALLGEVKGKRFLLPRAEEAREILPQTLRERGATVDVVTVYRTQVARDSAAALSHALGEVDCVTFLSGSAVDAFVELVGAERAASVRAAVAVIGPVTRQAAEAAGLTVTLEAPAASAEALAAAIDAHFT